MTKYKISTKVSVYSLISYALFIAIVKPYFLPDAVRQIVKIMILVGVLLFTITRLKTKKLLNISLLFCMCVLISSLVAIFRDNYQFRDFLDSILYALTIYDLYTFAELCSTKGCIESILFVVCLHLFRLLLWEQEHLTVTRLYIFSEINLHQHIFLFF